MMRSTVVWNLVYESYNAPRGTSGTPLCASPFETTELPSYAAPGLGGDAAKLRDVGLSATNGGAVSASAPPALVVGRRLSPVKTSQHDILKQRPSIETYLRAASAKHLDGRPQTQTAQGRPSRWRSESGGASRSRPSRRGFAVAAGAGAGAGSRLACR